MKKGAIIRYWRKRGGTARAYWLDESRTIESPEGPIHQVRVRPVAPENAKAVWVSVHAIYIQDSAGEES